MKRVLYLLPGRIATQLIVLVALSAVIFHFCMSGAFLLNRNGWFPAPHPGVVGRVSYASSLVKQADPADRDAVLRASGTGRPRSRPSPRAGRCGGPARST